MAYRLAEYKGDTLPVPQIVLEGRRGGSALAVTTLHAVMESA